MLASAAPAALAAFQELQPVARAVGGQGGGEAYGRVGAASTRRAVVGEPWRARHFGHLSLMVRHGDVFELRTTHLAVER